MNLGGKEKSNSPTDWSIRSNIDFAITWTWVDDAPWGFAPFHYGRWAFVTGRWVWVPGTMVARPVYAPALVVFVGGGPGDPNAQGIGWFPLGPREVYVLPHAVSTAYVQRVNVTTVNITVEHIERINVTQVTYVNRNASYAMTAVPRQAFTTGRPTNASTFFFTPDQARRAPIIGMGATVAPQRESVVFSHPAPAPRPPAQVVGRPVYGRLVPAPAPQPFSAQPAPMAPVTGYRPPPQAPPPQAPPVRQSAPVVINPTRPGQPPAMRPQQPQGQPQQPQQPQVQASPSDKEKDNQGRGKARSLLNDRKLKTLPAVQRKLDAARRNKGSRLDLDSLSRQLDAARSGITSAESTLSTGNADAALQQAQSIQRQLAEIDRQLGGGRAARGKARNGRH